ncbi:Hypothetical predicted protein, partial [Olea europaea subsp. europaea]
KLRSIAIGAVVIVCLEHNTCVLFEDLGEPFGRPHPKRMYGHTDYNISRTWSPSKTPIKTYLEDIDSDHISRTP